MARKEPARVRIADITSPDMYVTVTAEVEDVEISPVLSIHQKGILKDVTGSCEFVLWEKSFAAGVPELEEGKVYEIAKAYTKVYNPPAGGQINQVSITSWSEVTDKSDVQRGQQILGEL